MNRWELAPAVSQSAASFLVIMGQWPGRGAAVAVQPEQVECRIPVVLETSRKHTFCAVKRRNVKTEAGMSAPRLTTVFEMRPLVLT
jgi:hypothetical protein